MITQEIEQRQQRTETPTNTKEAATKKPREDERPPKEIQKAIEFGNRLLS